MLPVSLPTRPRAPHRSSLQASGLIHSGDSQNARSSSSSRHESRNCCERHAGRSPSAGGDCRRSQRPAKACLAGENHPGDGRWLRHRRDHAAIREGEAGGVALAGAFHAGGRGRSDPGQDPQTWQAAAAGGHGAAGGRFGALVAAGRNDPLDWTDAGEGSWRELAVGAADS